MSKFDFSTFYGDGYDHFAASKERYDKQQAISVYIREMMMDPGTKIAIGHAFVRYRIGYQDGEKINGWWLEYEDFGRSCPVWCFHVHRGEHEIATFEEDYEYYIIKQEDVS